MTEELATLTKTEQDRLAALESAIRAGLESFMEVGLALSEIRESKLYRGTHGTFEAYCEASYGFSGRRGRQLMQAAKIGTVVPLSSEAQARALAPLLDDPEQLRGALEEATGNGKATGAKIKEAVAKRLPPKAETEATVTAGGKSPAGEQLVLDLDGDKGPRWKAEADRRGYSLPEFVDACVESQLARDAREPELRFVKPSVPQVSEEIGPITPVAISVPSGGKRFTGPDPKVKGPVKEKAARGRR